jgi:hypothetical protein
MANKIVLKKSSVVGKVPQVNDLEYGELALNYADNRLYFKASDNTINSFIAGSGSSSNVLVNGAETITLNSDGTLSLTNPGTLFDNSKEYELNSNNQILDTFDKTNFRSAKYFIQAISGSDVYSSEILLTHNDENVYITEYGIVFSQNELISVSATIDSSNVNLIVTPLYNDTKIDFIRHTLVARELTLLEGDLMELSGSIDLMEGDGVFDLNAA